MEVFRFKNVFLILVFMITHTNNEKPPIIHNSTCPFSKIIEDIFQIKKHPSPINTSDRAKIFLHSIANLTNTNKYKNITEEELVNDIIAAINRIKNNITEENSKEQKLNEAIVLFPNETTINKVTVIKSGVEEKMDLNKLRKPTEKITTTTEKTNFVEILTIEPNNTQHNNKSNVTTHNIVEILKHFIPMFNTSKNDLHNITIIESNIIKNHSISASKNVSTIIVTYCDPANNTNNLTNINNNRFRENDYYDDESPDAEEEEEEEIVTDGEKRDILEASEYGMKKMHELYSVLEPKLYSMGLWLDETNPARYVAAFNAPSEDATRYTRYGYASLQAAAKLKELTSASSEALEGRTEENQFPSAAALRQSPLMQHCPLKGTPKCPPASKRYRTHDGTCNNINKPRWGSTMTPVQRFLPPSYSDGLQAPRRSVFGSQLPSARDISALVHESKNVETPGITHLLMQWGQFVDHDVTSSSQSRGFNGSVPRCCRDGGRDFVPKELMHPECFPIAVPPSDPFYGPRRVRCLDFVRSSPAPRDDCALGWREQLNQVSAYIDGSPLYASSARQSDKLRLFRNGMLQYGRVQQRRPVLPPERRDELCRGGAVSTECFKSGDGRVNEHPGLVAAHIVWLRHHNRMAQELAHLNPHWSDEKIYQETRKIVGAMIQHITYKEFLPIVLGPDVMEIFELDLLKKGYFKEYNPKINPSPASSFGSAAFRFGHSLVQPSMMRFDRFHRPMHNNVSLHNELTNPSNIWSIGAVDRLLLGMVNQPIQKRDEFITEELTNHLFQTPQFDFGMDLAAINIQRGRDHGVPPYTAWREPCGLSALLEFDDLVKVMPARAVRKLKVLYRHVDDIDLFTGGMAERPVVGGLVGPTFACIIAQQFSNLRRGDRFWYENGGFDSSFTPAQLQQIRRISFAQVLCRTLDSIDSIQPFAFLSADHFDNNRISCQNGILNNFDLSPWIEIDSESDNDIRKSDKITTQKPNRKKPSTSRPTTTTKAIKNSIKSTKKPQIKVSSTTQKQTDNVNATTKENIDSNNDTLTNKINKTNMTVQIDDKLDFKNKTKRLDDTDIDFRNRPSNQYNADYDDDEDLSVQSVVINNSGYNKRPYNYKRPILTVTENTNKYTYLINYVPRPTESYRHTTRRAPERDVVKVTYQTYDDTYRRPNRPYYYNRDDNNNYRYNRPNRRTTVDDMHSSARSNNNIERTTTKSKTTIKTDDFDKKDKIDKTPTTTENLYKLVTFGYIGSYRGDAADQLNMKLDQMLSPKSDDMTLKTDDVPYKTDDMTFKIDDMTSKTDDLPLTDKDADENHGIISKDFSTYMTKQDISKGKTDFTKVETDISKDKTDFTKDETDISKDKTDFTKDETDISKDKTDFTKLSTFFTYETSTKSYQPRSTRLNDENYNPYLYPKNNIYRQTDTNKAFTTENPQTIKDIIKENYKNPGTPQVNIEERSSLDIMAEEHDTVSKSAVNKLRIKVRKPAGPAQTPSVAFQVIPSEVNPTQWAVYDEDLDLPDALPLLMPPMRPDPHALKEIPRPISLIGLRRRRPGRF